MLRTNDDPRALRSRAAALAAATELLVEGGPENVTHATVAKRAGIGRATVYRHWPDQQALLLDALAGDIRPLLSFDDSPVRDQLVTQAEQMAHRLNQPSAVSILATVIQRAERDEGVRRLREEMFGRADEDLTRALATAVERGELRPGAQDHARDLVARIISRRRAARGGGGRPCRHPRLTCLASLAGLPAVVAPLLRVRSLPVGLCALGAPGTDRALLDFITDSRNPAHA